MPKLGSNTLVKTLKVPPPTLLLPVDLSPVHKRAPHHHPRQVHCREKVVTQGRIFLYYWYTFHMRCIIRRPSNHHSKPCVKKSLLVINYAMVMVARRLLAPGGGWGVYGGGC